MPDEGGQELEGGETAVSHKHKRPFRHPATGLEDQLARPVGEFLVPFAVLAAVPLRGRQGGQEGQRPDPPGPNRHLAAFLDDLTGAKAVRAGRVSFEAGLANRKSVLGVEHVERSLKNAGAFAMPWQDFITRTAWGEVWGDPTLPQKVRSFVTLAMMVALHREEEFKLHVRPALRNGVTLDELQALLLQTAIYAGVPATNAAFRWVKEVLGDEMT
jgi:4-carboxymuconolactone decarboxylase